MEEKQHYIILYGYSDYPLKGKEFETVEDAEKWLKEYLLSKQKEYSIIEKE
jgi:hypothetical protein